MTCKTSHSAIAKQCVCLSM